MFNSSPDYSPHHQHHPNYPSYRPIPPPSHQLNKSYHPPPILPSHHHTAHQQYSSSHQEHYGLSVESQRWEAEGQQIDNIAQLQERLKNIHHYYGRKMEEEKSKSMERTEVIINLVEELQFNHSLKIADMQKMIRESEEQKKDAGFVDERMNQIKGSIDDLIQQSQKLKTKNSQLEHEIQQKSMENREKENELQHLNGQLIEARNTLQSFEISNLKNNKINREIMEIFNIVDSLRNSNQYER